MPEEALRVVTTTQTDADGNTTESKDIGVYCVVGIEARFKPVEVVYSGENFVIAKSTAGEDQENIRLRPGDQVIVQARGLYDGKVVG